MRISDWSSDVCSSDLIRDNEVWIFYTFRLGQRQQLVDQAGGPFGAQYHLFQAGIQFVGAAFAQGQFGLCTHACKRCFKLMSGIGHKASLCLVGGGQALQQTVHGRSEEHTSELQSLMRISYAVFCLKKKQTKHITYQQ